MVRKEEGWRAPECCILLRSLPCNSLTLIVMCSECLHWGRTTKCYTVCIKGGASAECGTWPNSPNNVDNYSQLSLMSSSSYTILSHNIACIQNKPFCKSWSFKIQLYLMVWHLVATFHLFFYSLKIFHILLEVHSFIDLKCTIVDDSH